MTFIKSGLIKTFFIKLVITIFTTKFNTKKIPTYAYAVDLCALYGSQNKQRLLPYAAVFISETMCLLRGTDWLSKYN